MDAWLIIGMVLTGIGLVQAGLMLVHAWEHRRFHVRRLARPLEVNHGARVGLIAPCKGLDPDLRDNLLALFRQRHTPCELCFVVEGDDDPAVPVIRNLAGENPHVPCRVVTAGIARDSGQKVHNLIAAAEALLADESPPDILAFVDSDACPHADWLGRLVDRLAGGKHAVATGYRWYVPAKDTFANRLLSAINNTVIGVMGPHGFNLVWGGAWAIRREEFTKLGLPAAWRGTLSDDLIVSRLVHAARLRVGYEPHCLVNSTADFDVPKLCEFLRRQFTVAKVYAPLWWHFALWSGLVTNACIWGLVGLSAAGLATGNPRTVVAASAGAALVWALGALRAHLAAIAVRPFIAVTDGQYDSVSRLNFWGWPVVALANWIGVVSAAWGHTITWRGIRYRLDSPHQTTIYEHLAQRPTTDDERDSHARTTTRAA
ncbi:MAG: glycosyltransferase [Planctomycetia bacterium]|nr:glycosyltransferase [Planctomycetia bacterium]